MKTSLRVLLIEDSESDAWLITRQLEKAGYAVTADRVETAAQMKAALKKQTWDLVLADYQLPQFDAPAALAILQSTGLDVPFIVISGTIGEETAVALMRTGAHDYLMKDHLARLEPAVQRELAEAQVRRERKQAEESLRQSEAALRKAQQVAHVGNWTWYIQSNQLDWSDEMCRIFSIDRAQHVGSLKDAILKAVHPDDRAKVEQSIFTVEHDQKPLPFEYRVLRSDQSVLIVWSEAGEWLLDEAGNKVCLSGIVQDITERKRREDELQVMVNVSAVLRTAATRAEILSIILDQASTLTGTAQVSLVLCDGAAHECISEIGGGDWTEIQAMRLPFLISATRSIIASGNPYLCEDAGADSNLAKAFPVTRPLMLAAVPLLANQQAIGVLWAGRYGGDLTHRMFTPAEVRLLSAIADIAANAINRTTLYEEAQRVATDLALAYDTTIKGWSRAMDLRDRETEDHTERVTEITLQLAQAMGIGPEQMIHIRRGALLHDIGKMGIPDSVLLKPGTLTEREWEIMRRHPEYAFTLLTPIEYLRPALDIPYCHHEKWDGSGYPRGLKGEEIPLSARLFAIADVWDALISDRPYRAAWPKEKALIYVCEQSGSHFDPKVVESFLKILAL